MYLNNQCCIFSSNFTFIGILAAWNRLNMTLEFNKMCTKWVRFYTGELAWKVWLWLVWQSGRFVELSHGSFLRPRWRYLGRQQPAVARKQTSDSNSGSGGGDTVQNAQLGSQTNQTTIHCTGAGLVFAWVAVLKDILGDKNHLKISNHQDLRGSSGLFFKICLCHSKAWRQKNRAVFCFGQQHSTFKTMKSTNEGQPNRAPFGKQVHAASWNWFGRPEALGKPNEDKSWLLRLLGKIRRIRCGSVP